MPFCESEAVKVIRRITKHDQLTPSHVIDLGQAYLDAYPRPTPRYQLGFLGNWGTTHTNQVQARNLTDLTSSSTCRGAWQKLIDVFRALPNDSGELAEVISDRLWFVLKVQDSFKHNRGGAVTQRMIADDAQSRLDGVFPEKSVAMRSMHAQS